MSKSSIVIGILALSLMGCEREAIGETFEGQKSGGRSIRVTGSSPARGATLDPKTAPASLSNEPFRGSVSPADPAIRGQLAASGATRVRQQRRPGLRGAGNRVAPPGMPLQQVPQFAHPAQH